MDVSVLCIHFRLKSPKRGDSRPVGQFVDRHWSTLHLEPAWKAPGFPLANPIRSPLSPWSPPCALERVSNRRRIYGAPREFRTHARSAGGRCQVQDLGCSCLDLLCNPTSAINAPIARKPCTRGAASSIKRRSVIGRG